MSAKTCLQMIAMLVVSGPVFGQSAARMREFSLETIEELGLELYRHDYAAAIGTERLYEEGIDPAQEQLLGWITIDDDVEDVVHVAFIGIDDGEYASKFDVSVDSSGDSTFARGDGRALTDVELSRFLARQTALRGIRDQCLVDYNLAVLRDPVDDGWLVYMLSAPSQAGVIPVGGFYRVSVSADGTRRKQVDRLDDTCDVIDLRSGDSGEAIVPVEFFPITLAAGDTPLEPHVMLNLLYGVAVEIRTPTSEKAWRVMQGRIIEIAANP